MASQGSRRNGTMKIRLTGKVAVLLYCFSHMSNVNWLRGSKNKRISLTPFLSIDNDVANPPRIFFEHIMYVSVLYIDLGEGMYIRNTCLYNPSVHITPEMANVDNNRLRNRINNNLV